MVKKKKRYFYLFILLYRLPEDKHAWLMILIYFSIGSLPFIIEIASLCKNLHKDPIWFKWIYTPCVASQSIKKERIEYQIFSFYIILFNINSKMNSDSMIPFAYLFSSCFQYNCFTQRDTII